MTVEVQVINQSLGYSAEYELIQHCQKGDRSAFNKLILNYQDTVFNICIKFLRDREDANDVAQEVFVKLFLSLNKFRFKSKFSTWLYRIIINTCKNKVRTLKYKKNKDTLWLDRTQNGHEEYDRWNQYGEEDKTLESLMINENKQKIHAVLQSMPENFRTVLILRDIEGQSYKEIEEITKCNFGTVQSRLARARQKLKHMLKGAFSNEL